MSQNKNRFVLAAIIGTLISAIFITLVTVLGELFSPLKTLLADAHHHHWIGKGVWAGILFFASFLITYAVTRAKDLTVSLPKMITFTAYMMALGSIVLFVFFIYEYGVHH